MPAKMAAFGFRESGIGHDEDEDRETVLNPPKLPLVDSPRPRSSSRSGGADLLIILGDASASLHPLRGPLDFGLWDEVRGYLWAADDVLLCRAIASCRFCHLEERNFQHKHYQGGDKVED